MNEIEAAKGLRAAFYARQKYLFTAVFILVAIVPLLALNYNAALFYRASWMEKTRTELVTQANDRRALVEHFLASLEDVLAAVLAIDTVDSLRRPERIQALFATLEGSGVVSDVGVIDAQGNHLAYRGPHAEALAGRNYAHTPWFAQVMRNGRYASDVFLGYRRVPHMIVAVADPARTGILRVTIDSTYFNDLVASAHVGPGGDAFIVNRRGELQTPSRLGRSRIDGATLQRLLALAESGGTALWQDDRIHAAALLNAGQWLLVLETNVATSLADYERARRRDTALVAVAALLIVLVAALFTRSMIARLARAEREHLSFTQQVREVEKLALVGRLAASIAHEVNNPLQIIADQAGLMQDLLEEEEAAALRHHADYRRALGRIRGQVRRTRAITHRLLGFSRPTDEEIRPTDLNRALEETIALLEPEASRQRIVIERHYQEDLPPVSIDAAQLQQVVLNLLDNALDAIGRDGRIDVGSHLRGEYVRVEVADSGPGLGTEVIEHLYDPFFTTKPKGKGTGLGLYVSSEIMARLGGRLTAANAPGGGAVFTLHLPLGGPGRQFDQDKTGSPQGRATPAGG